MKLFSQKGVIAICTALVMPVLLGAVGLTVDFGNAYLHKAQLQNAADSAVLAGVQSYASKKDLSAANSVADAYLNMNNSTATESAKYSLDSTANIYKVVTEETVPTYFLKMFNLHEMGISAKSSAVYTTKGGLFKRLMTFGTTFKEKTSEDSSGNAYHLFNGSVAYVNSNPTVRIDGSESYKLNYQYDSERGSYNTLPILYDKGSEMYPSAAKSFVNKLRNSADYNFTRKTLGSTVDLSAYDGKIIHIDYYSNLLLTLSSKLQSLTYVVIDGGDSLYFDVTNENTNNNLVLIYAPTDDNVDTAGAHGAKSDVHLINTSGTAHTFEGLIYAPYGGVTFNKASDSTDFGTTNGVIDFYGCLAADSIEIKENTQGNFTYNSKWGDAKVMSDASDSGNTTVVTALID